jgi:hypothetical protein
MAANQLETTSPDDPDDKMFDEWARRNPIATLSSQYSRLSDVQFDFCIRKIIHSALFVAIIQPDVTARLSEAHLDIITKEFPGDALQHEHLCTRLTPIQFDDCIKRYPISYPRYSARLTPYQQSWLKKISL